MDVSGDLSIFDGFRKRSLGGGDVLFREGDSGEMMYVVLRGKVRVSKKVIEGSDKILDELGPGQVFGEMSLLTGAGRSATATVMEEAELVEFDRLSFEQLLQREPDVGVDFMRQMAERLERVDEEIIYLSLEKALAEKALRLHRPSPLAPVPGGTTYVALGFFSPEHTRKVLSFGKALAWSGRVNVLASVYRPGRESNMLIHVVQTDAHEQLVEMLRVYGEWVRWDLSFALPLDDEALERLL